MDFARFLSHVDAARVSRVMAKFGKHRLLEFALTGSLALETHLARGKGATGTRALNDIDLVVESFGSIPDAVTDGFLIRHVHPNAPEGKLLIQLVDPGEALRIDVFRAYGATMPRSRLVSFPTGAIRVVSLEDLAARAASLLMDLSCRLAVPLKHARDCQRMVDQINPNQIEAAWGDHRKTSDPETFSEASRRVRDLVDSHLELLVIPEYSRDVNAVCRKCEETGRFRTASPITVLAILGYCTASLWF